MQVTPVVVFDLPSPIAVFVVAFRKVVVLLHHFNRGSMLAEPAISPDCKVIPMLQPEGAASRYLHVVPQSEPSDGNVPPFART